MEQKNVENSTVVEKKVFIFSIFLLGLLIISAIIICYFLLSDKILNDNEVIDDENIPTFDENINEPQDDTTHEEIQYMLKEYNGKIGVYENNALVYTIDTYVFTLPEIDKRLLNDGIKVFSKMELYELIEEYY